MIFQNRFYNKNVTWASHSPVPPPPPPPPPCLFVMMMRIPLLILFYRSPTPTPTHIPHPPTFHTQKNTKKKCTAKNAIILPWCRGGGFSLFHALYFFILFGCWCNDIINYVFLSLFLVSLLMWWWLVAVVVVGGSVLWVVVVHVEAMKLSWNKSNDPSPAHLYGVIGKLKKKENKKTKSTRSTRRKANMRNVHIFIILGRRWK